MTRRLRCRARAIETRSRRSSPQAPTRCDDTSAEPRPTIPRYGDSSLADLTPSVLAALGCDAPNPLALGPLRAACVLLVDGLGWNVFLENRDRAPFLSAAASHGDGRPLTAGFPSTTATSLASLGTGTPPGEHGLVGYTFAVPGHDRPMNALRWELYGIGPNVDLQPELAPEAVQPLPTWPERARAQGVEIVRLGPPDLRNTPLSRATFRGARYLAAYSAADLVAVAGEAMSTGERFVLAYHAQMDTIGHVRGVRSEAWALELANVDAMAERIGSRLPPESALIVTGDHGMVDLDEGDRHDVSDVPGLAGGVRALGGEARARHVYASPGAEGDVLAAWREVVDDRMWVRSREEAIADGWFGPTVVDRARGRIGDVVAAAFAPIGIFDRATDPHQATLVGHHGSLTAAEQHVPLLLVRT